MYGVTVNLTHLSIVSFDASHLSCKEEFGRRKSKLYFFRKPATPVKSRTENVILINQDLDHIVPYRFWHSGCGFPLRLCVSSSGQG